MKNTFNAQNAQYAWAASGWAPFSRLRPEVRRPLRKSRSPPGPAPKEAIPSGGTSSCGNAKAPIPPYDNGVCQIMQVLIPRDNIQSARSHLKPITIGLQEVCEQERQPELLG
ncbi:unnamed protein product, partial [Mesorhabditis spiculigera]